MKNKHNTILEWIEKADHDLGAAKLIFLHMPTNEELEVSIQIADFFRSFAIQSIGIRE